MPRLGRLSLLVQSRIPIWARYSCCSLFSRLDRLILVGACTESFKYLKRITFKLLERFIEEGKLRETPAWNCRGCWSRGVLVCWYPSSTTAVALLVPLAAGVLAASHRELLHITAYLSGAL